MNYPLWATPERRAYLVELFLQDPLACDINLFTQEVVNPFGEVLITYWKGDDRDARSFLWKLEKRRLHALRKIKRRGQFDSIKREQYLADRPTFRIVAIGVDAFTHRRVVKVELPGLGEALWIPFTGLKARKSKLRKLARYGGKVPKDLVEPLEKVVSRVVAEYLNNSPQG